MPITSVKLTLNGTQHTLSYNASTEMYEGTITSPAVSSYSQSGHYYGATVTVTDSDGNTTTLTPSDATYGQYLRLFVKDVTGPSIIIQNPTSLARITTNTPTFTWIVTDTSPGVDPDTIGIKVDNGSKITGSAITKTEITNGYSCTYTMPSTLSEGSHTIYVDASDTDGVAGTQASVSFTVDTVVPALSVSSPNNNSITNSYSVTVAGTTSDITSGPPTVTVQVNSGSPVPVTVTNGAFSQSFILVKRVNTITVVATDLAGKTSTVTRTVIVDTLRPSLTSVYINPNPTDASSTYTIAIALSDPETVTAYLVSSSGKRYTTRDGNKLTIAIH